MSDSIPSLGFDILRPCASYKFLYYYRYLFIFKYPWVRISQRLKAMKKQRCDCYWSGSFWDEVSCRRKCIEALLCHRETLEQERNVSFLARHTADFLFYFILYFF